MRQILAVLVVTLGYATGLLGFAAAQDATQVPDLKGRWVAISESIVLGYAIHHCGHEASQNKPRLSSAEFTLTIEGQDGRRFWGTIESEKHQEPIIGVIGFDGKTVHMQEHDGSLDGTLADKDTLEVIFHHSTANTIVVSMERFKRQ
jgi:hypothetical protein